MPRKKKQQRKQAEQHTHLVIRVESYEASTEASVNHNVYGPQYAWNLNDDDPLYEFSARLTITGIAIEPKERAGDMYELTLYADDFPSQRLKATLKDAQVRNEYGSPQYRTYRGKEIPVYRPPSGLGHLDKVRGEPRWTAWLFVRPHFASDTLTLLGHGRTLYLTVHERKESRERWIQGLTLQTERPDEE